VAIRKEHRIGPIAWLITLQGSVEQRISGVSIAAGQGKVLVYTTCSEINSTSPSFIKPLGRLLQDRSVRKQCPAVEIIVEVLFTIKTYSNALDVWVVLPVHGNMHQGEQIGI